MLRMTESYTRHHSTYGFAVFKVVSTVPDELEAFWSENKTTLGKPQFDAADETNMEFKINDQEKVKNLIYRFNMNLNGKHQQMMKREFLDQCGLEAIVSVIYATDFIPDGMAIGEYAAVVLKAYEDHNDGLGFDERLINTAGLPLNQMGLIINQIQLFKNLLTIPFEDEL